MIFISTPYSHQYREVVNHRVKIAAYYAAHLLKVKGDIPISPVLMGDRIRQEVDLPGDIDTWVNLCYSFLRKSNEMHILMLDGWMESKGVDAEIDCARKEGIPIRYIEFFQPIPNAAYHFRENEAMTKKEKQLAKIEKIKQEIIDKKKYA